MRAFPLVAGGLAVVAAVVGLAVESLVGGRTAVITQAELERHGPDRGDPWLALLGHVFDVSSAPEFYGADGSYKFFSGRDASRAFSTGDFENDLHDDVVDMSTSSVVDIFNWLESTFQAKYPQVGVLEGTYFDAQGAPTDAYNRLLALHSRAAEEKELTEAARARYPACESHWRQGHGGQRKCTDTARRPRKAFPTPESKDYICVCVLPGEGDPALLRVWDGCDEDASSCPIPP